MGQNQKKRLRKEKSRAFVQTTPPNPMRKGFAKVHQSSIKSAPRFKKGTKGIVLRPASPTSVVCAPTAPRPRTHGSLYTLGIFLFGLGLAALQMYLFMHYSKGHEEEEKRAFGFAGGLFLIGSAIVLFFIYAPLPPPLFFN